MKYTIEGTPMPVVICEMSDGEKIITEKGSMSWMSPNMQMETIGGGIGKAIGRAFSGESMFLNHYTARGDGMIALASSFPGEIRAVEITPDKPLICQKSAFLGCTPGVELSVHFQKKFGAGLFGGEGFIMQKLSGTGLAFIEIDGSSKEYVLQAGQSIIVDTGYLVAMDHTCNMEIKTVAGLKNKLLGGEGFFNTVVTGPGRVIIQTMPASKMAGVISRYVVVNTK